MFSLLLLILMSDTEAVTPGPRSRAARTSLCGCEADAWCPREILLAQHPAARPGVTMLG